MDSRDFINKFDSQFMNLCFNMLDFMKAIKEQPNNTVSLRDFYTVYNNKNVALFAVSIGLVVYNEFPKKYQDSQAERKIYNSIDGACTSFTGEDYHFMNLYRNGITDIAICSYVVAQNMKSEESLF